MCSDRLAAGEAPACVQACPHEAIRIRVVDDAEVIARAEAGAFLPGTLDPGYTLPTTHFRTSHLMGPGDMQPVDDHHRRARACPLAADRHACSDAAFGGRLLGGACRGLAAEIRAGALGRGSHVILCLGFGWAGLGASVLHLGRPLPRVSRSDRTAAFLAQPRGARVRALRHACHGLRITRGAVRGLVALPRGHCGRPCWGWLSRPAVRALLAR